MSQYEPSTYGDRIADAYDEMYPIRANVEPAVNALAKLAGDGPALELGIGTGRIALPLAERGIEVHGIDASGAIVEKMRAKAGGADIPVTIGDFADVGVDGKFSMVYVVFNTFYALLTQEDQVRCFQNVAEHLTDNGVFVIEAFVTDVTRFVRGQNISVTSIETDSAMIDLTRHDPVSQIVTSQHLIVSEGGVKLYPVKLRYVWPSELDLMAQLAGLRLRSRHADWDESPFTSASGSHVSVYGRDL